MNTTLNKEQIIALLPHREPMLLIDELLDIKKLFSATAIVNVKKDSFFVQGHFPGNPVMPGVLIVEAFGQAAAALTAAGIDKTEYENKLVFLMSVEKAKFRNERNDNINSLNNQRLEATSKMITLVRPILSDFSDKNSISLIIDKKNIIIGKTLLDITDDILTIIDEKIGKIQLD